MIDSKRAIEIAERNIAGTDMFVVDCTSSPSGDIELIIDSDTSVSIDACAYLSRAIEAELDREQEDFSLTVASAGIGSSIEVLLVDSEKILAQLDTVDEEGITLCYDERRQVEGMKRKQTVRVTRRYEWSQIRRAKEWLDFK